MGKFKLLLLFVLLSGPSAFALRTEAEWIQAREEMCAAPSTPSPKEKTEGQAECPECLGKLPVAANALESQNQSKKILAAAQRDREILFLREWLSVEAMTPENAKSIISVFEGVYSFMQTGVFSEEENTVQKSWTSAMTDLASKNSDPTPEEKTKILEISSQLENILAAKIQAQQNFQFPDGDNGSVKTYTDSALKIFKSGQDSLKKIKSYLSDNSFKKTEILNNVPAVVAPSTSTSSAMMKVVKSQLDTAKARIKSLEVAALNSAQKGLSPEDELKRLENTVWEILKLHGFPRNHCGMSVAELLSIVQYTGSGYAGLNSALRDASNLPESMKAFRDILKSALRKVKAYKGEVRRGADLPLQAVLQHSPGEILTYSAFTSTSLESGFSGSQQFVIKSKNGKFIAPLSSSPVEEEVLFDAETKFKVLSKELKEPIGEYDSEEIKKFKMLNVRIVLEEVE